MSRMPIQIDMQVKQDMENLRDNKFRVKTHSDTLEKLITYFHQTERQKAEDSKKREQERDDERKKWFDERQRQQREDVNLGEGLKARMEKFTQDFKFRTQADAIEFLLDAFEASPQMDKAVFKMYVDRI